MLGGREAVPGSPFAWALSLSHSSSFSRLEPPPVGPAVPGYPDHVVLQLPELL